MAFISMWTHMYVFYNKHIKLDRFNQNSLGRVRESVEEKGRAYV